MTESDISRYVSGAFMESGWSLSRNVVADRPIRALRRHGYHVHANAIDVLRQFAGLRVDIVLKDEQTGCAVQYRLRMGGRRWRARCASRTFREWLKGSPPPDAAFLRWHKGADACFVGFMDQYCPTRFGGMWAGHGYLYSAADSTIIWCDAEWAGMSVGTDVVTVIDHVCGGRRGPVEDINLDVEEINVKIIELGLLAR